MLLVIQDKVRIKDGISMCLNFSLTVIRCGMGGYKSERVRLFCLYLVFYSRNFSD